MNRNTSRSPAHTGAVPGAAFGPLHELEEHAQGAARLLRALANRYRLMVLCALGDGERSVGALNERVPLSQSALSQHLAVLRADGLVRTRREGQTIFYRVTEGPALQIIRVLYAAYCGGNRARRRTPPAVQSGTTRR
ncbi:MAG: winged helix-turn-helix transcriptional regulator [Gammaproteobacteria bacterium]|nr:winged helix-turn-helix transcriptional regulator [Gammaproteobacteria bacterium]